MLREETARAMRACRFAWGFYIQADEVLHEDGVAPLRSAFEDAERIVYLEAEAAAAKGRRGRMIPSVEERYGTADERR